MLFAALTLLSWTVSAYGSSRCSRRWGSVRGNRYRLSLAIPLLLLIYLLSDDDLTRQPGLWLFLLGGICHLGFGDIGLYGTYRSIGPRLGTLICLCLAAPIALVVEWVWLGTAIPATQLACMAWIIIAVVVALAPTERLRLGAPAIRNGLLCGLLAAGGQGLGAVVTRQGYAIAEEAEQLPGAFSAALLRTGGGFAVLASLGLLGLLLGSRDVAAAYSSSTSRAEGQDSAAVWPWLLLAAVVGPVLGVAAYQKAFETTPAAYVQATLVCLPVTMIPVTWLLDGDRPSRRSVFGGLTAVAGVAALVLTM